MSSWLITSKGHRRTKDDLSSIADDLWQSTIFAAIAAILTGLSFQTIKVPQVDFCDVPFSAFPGRAVARNRAGSPLLWRDAPDSWDAFEAMGCAASGEERSQPSVCRRGLEPGKRHCRDAAARRKARSMRDRRRSTDGHVRR